MLRLLLLTIIVAFSSACAHALPTKNEELARELVSFMVKGDIAKVVSHFDPNMRGAVSENGLREILASERAKTGQFTHISTILTEKADVYDVIGVICKCEKADWVVKLVFNSSGQVAGLFFDQMAKPIAVPSLFPQRKVTIGKKPWALPGILTLPKGKGPFPVVVLVHGSGPNDREETIGLNKPFRDIADGLAAKGIAVCSYDKRTFVYGSEKVFSLPGASVKEEAISDALAAVAILKNTKTIDSKRIFVLGHSLGGMLAPRIGKMDPKIAGLIVVAGPARPMIDLIIEQYTYIFGLDDLSDDDQKRLDILKSQQVLINSPELANSSEKPLGFPASYWLDLRGYKPAEYAKDVKQPFLILQGGRDYQVTAVDYELWKTALGSRKNVTLKFYPKLNHIMMTGEGKSTPSEYGVAGHVDGQVINDIAAWVKTKR